MNNRLKKKIEIADLRYREFMQVKGVEVVAACVELERIASEHGGQLFTADVIDAARNKKNPLHPAFEWDDTVAAERFRTEQARKLIKSIRVVYEDRPDEPKFVHVRVGNAGYYADATATVADVDEWERAKKGVEEQIARTRRQVDDFIRIARAAGREKDAREIVRDLVSPLM